MKNIVKIIFMVLFALVFCSTVMAAEIKCSPWARKIVEDAAENGYVPNILLQKADGAINRKELSSLVVQFYEKHVNTEYTPNINNVFIDTNDSDILAAVELGFFSGVSETEFNPDGIVTREQMAVVMNKLFTKLGIELINYQPSDQKFNDDKKISSWAKESVSILKKNGILNGDSENNFNPQNITTVEQCIVVIMQTKATTAVTSTTGAEAVRNGISSISLGEDKSKVILKLGEPDRIDKNIYGFERYVYTGNYENFIMIGIKNNKVAEIYTNSKNLGYGKIDSSTTYKTMDFKGFDEYSNEKASYSNGKYIVTVYFDTFENAKIDAIHLRVSDLKESEDFYSSSNEQYVEQELFDIINSTRVKNGSPMIKINPYLSVVSKAHSLEMKSYLRGTYYSVKGLSPFERMDKAGIKYRSAAENICTEISGDAIEIYGLWMSNVSTRINLMEDGFSEIGIGCASSNVKNRFYTTIDLIGY